MDSPLDKAARANEREQTERLADGRFPTPRSMQEEGRHASS